VQIAPFFVATMGLGEVSLVTHDELAGSIHADLFGYSPTLYLPELSSLTMQVGIETVDIPRQSYTVIKQLAIRDINIVEYITSPTELTIILHDRDLKESFVILHDRFFDKL
jgi:aspartokinase